MHAFSAFLKMEYFGNSVGQYLWFVLIILFGLLFKKILSHLSNRIIFFLLKKKAAGVPLVSFQSLLHPPLSLIFMLILVLIAFKQLQFPDEWGMKPHHEFGLNMVLYRMYLVLLYAAFIWLGLRAADIFKLILLQRAEQSDKKSSVQILSFLVDGLKIVVVVLGVLIMLSVIFKINVVTLVAGLGIGGLAVALAARESLENLFGSFTIFLDKPFVVGDMVKVGEIVGSVEKVGFRSTRLRTLDKSYVTLPNKRMVDSDLENLSLRTFRRANFSVGLTYQTSIEQLRAIVSDIQTYIDQHPNTNDEGRVRFKEFTDSSLEIMIMYYVDTMDWTTYLNVREEINYRIMEIVATHGASFAFPSTSVYIEKSGN